MILTDKLASNSQVNNGLDLVFIDSNLDNYQTLISGMTNAEVILLDSTRNGINQITDVLASYQELSSIQIFSHGDSGYLQLGSASLHAENLIDYRSDLESWSNSLHENGDILLFGCNLGANARGVD